MVSYNEIIAKAKECKTGIEKKYELTVSSKWGYYIAKAIINPQKDIKKIDFDKAPNSQGTHISRQISKSDYIKLAKDLIGFVEKNKRLPNYLTYKSYKIRVGLYCYLFSKILVFYDENKRLPNEVNVNSKVFNKPVQTKNKVYLYFVKVFGTFDNTIDGALSKVKNKGYAYYYDDRYSNYESIDRIKKGLGVNCTDSCHVFYNIMKALIELGKYKKVECLHVNCSRGGHVKLRITMNDGSRIIRDPACVISDNNKGVSCTWCTNTPKAIDPSWFMSNLNK